MSIHLRTWILLVILLLHPVKGGAGVRDYWTATEIEITSSLVNHFHVSFCIYILNDSKSTFWPVQNDTVGINFFVSVWTIGQLDEFVTNMRTEENRAGKKMIVLKFDESSLLSIREISQRTNIWSLTWLIYSDKPLNNADFDGIYIPYNCEFIHINRREEIYLLTEIYRIERSSEIETTNFGFWTKENGLSIHEEFLYRRRKTLKFHLFPAFMGNEPPYIVHNGYLDGEHKFSGYFFEVWKEIEQRVKFGVVVSEQDAGKKFHIDDMHHVDFAIVPIAYSSFNLDHIDITQPIYESRTYLFGHRPGSELEWDSYLKPFDAETWWVSLGWMVCSSAALAVLYKIAWNYGTSETDAEYFIFTFTESLATVFRAMCMQGSDVTPRSSSCRLFFLSIYLTALVVSSAFSAALFSLLTIPTARAPFASFEQVINNNALKIGLIQNSEIYDILKEYTLKHPTSIQDKLLAKIGNGRDGNPRTLLEGLDSVCRSRTYVMVSELPHVLYMMQNMTRDCQEKVMPAGPTLLKSFIGFGVKKGSPYKEIIDIHILMMRNEGIIQRLLLNNWPPPIPTVQATWVRVTLADISPILYMFGLGALLAVIFLVVEKLHFFIFRRERSNGRKNVSNNSAALGKTFVSFSSKLQVDQDKMKHPAQLATVRVHNFWL